MSAPGGKKRTKKEIALRLQKCDEAYIKENEKRKKCDEAYTRGQEKLAKCNSAFEDRDSEVKKCFSAYKELKGKCSNLNTKLDECQASLIKKHHSQGSNSAMSRKIATLKAQNKQLHKQLRELKKLLED